MQQKTKPSIFKQGSGSAWTAERIARLERDEAAQLLANAERLGDAAVVALCTDALRTLPKRGPRSAAQKAAQPRLLARNAAFEARGVQLADRRTSWGGVTKEGALVFGLWAAAIRSHDGTCSYLLWAPSAAGSSPWYDTPPGRERLRHCELGAERGHADGLLVHGEKLDGHIPEDRARSVHGVDPETVVRFGVEKRGEEYWAVWGKSAAA